MPKVKNKQLGTVIEVADNHWALESSDFEVLKDEPVKEEPKKPEPKPKKE